MLKGTRRLGLSDYLDIRHIIVATLTVLRTGRHYLPGETPGISSVRG
jgi:hypothetical protein